MLDYCNSLLHGLPSKVLKQLQYVQNTAARIVTGVSRRDHITPVLYQLHWLPIESRILYKILLITYKTMNNQSPSYMQELIEPYVPTRSSLRSSNQCLLNLSHVETNVSLL